MLHTSNDPVPEISFFLSLFSAAERENSKTKAYRQARKWFRNPGNITYVREQRTWKKMKRNVPSERVQDQRDIIQFPEPGNIYRGSRAEEMKTGVK
jgi:hypothetical protein